MLISSALPPATDIPGGPAVRLVLTQLGHQRWAASRAVGSDFRLVWSKPERIRCRAPDPDTVGPDPEEPLSETAGTD